MAYEQWADDASLDAALSSPAPYVPGIVSTEPSPHALTHRNRHVPPDALRDWAPRVSSCAARLGQRVPRIITVRTGEAGEGWLFPMSSYPHDS